MRVAHFCESFSPLSETFIYDFVVELERQLGEQHVIALERENATDRPFQRVLTVPPPARWSPRRLWHRARVELGLLPAAMAEWPVARTHLETLLRDIRPDVLHAHFGPMGLLVAPVAVRLGLPLVSSFYGVDASQLLDDASWRPFMQAHVREFDTISLSEQMRARLLEVGASPERAHIVHLGKHLEDYAFSPPKRVRRFLSIGRMTEKKGHQDTVAAFAAVIKDCPEVHLDIVGGGELLEYVRDAVRALGLMESVRLHGPVAHSRVRQMLQSSDAFVLCSKRAANGDCEGTPTVLIEAQACGLPCVSTLHAGIPEMLPESNHHLLAPEGDVPGIAARMRLLIGAGAAELTQIAERGLAHVNKDYRVETEARKLGRIYERVTRSRETHASAS